MKVWFGCTTAEIEKYKDSYFGIRDYLKELGCIIVFDWLDEAYNFYEHHHGQSRDIKKVYQTVLKAINEAEAVVIEHTVPNFSSSHQINYSLLRQKPTLVLRQSRDNPNFADSYLEAIESPLLNVKQYERDDYKLILKKFIGESNIGHKQKRYNLVLTQKHDYFLDWAAVYFNKSRSEITREAIDRFARESDEYQKYLGKIQMGDV